MGVERPPLLLRIPRLLYRARRRYRARWISLYPTGMYDGSSRDRVAAFKLALDRTRVPSTVRLTRGRDIEAACGQLATAPKARTRRAPAPA